jgi:hypothetical protein
MPQFAYFLWMTWMLRIFGQVFRFSCLASDPSSRNHDLPRKACKVSKLWQDYIPPQKCCWPTGPDRFVLCYLSRWPSCSVPVLCHCWGEVFNLQMMVQTGFKLAMSTITLVLFSLRVSNKILMHVWMIRSQRSRSLSFPSLLVENLGRNA